MENAEFDKIFDRITSSKHVHEGVLFIENTNGHFSFKKEYGGKSIDSPLLMASISKLYTTACILILCEGGELSLDNPISKFIDQGILDQLHSYKGKDYSETLTVGNLLHQTSGLPDAFEEGSNNLKKRLLSEDIRVDFNTFIRETKQLKPHFAPGAVNKAYYADINFEILGRIVETITASSLEKVFTSYIIEPLHLMNTYVPVHEAVPDIYYKESLISRPEFIKSCIASGGIVSTAREMMIFLKAFFGGKLFNKRLFEQLGSAGKLQTAMYPIQYCGGYMKIPLSGFATMFKGSGELIGHSGSTGSFAFYYPEKDLYFAGDLNQLANPSLPVRMVMRLALGVK